MLAARHLSNRLNQLVIGRFGERDPEDAYPMLFGFGSEAFAQPSATLQIPRGIAGINDPVGEEHDRREGISAALVVELIDAPLDATSDVRPAA